MHVTGDECSASEDPELSMARECGVAAAGLDTTRVCAIPEMELMIDVPGTPIGGDSRPHDRQWRATVAAAAAYLLELRRSRYPIC